MIESALTYPSGEHAAALAYHMCAFQYGLEQVQALLVDAHKHAVQEMIETIVCYLNED